MTKHDDKRNDCGKYREIIGADPSSSAAAEHVAQCAECRAWRDEMRTLDARIAAALAIDVPEQVVPDLGNSAGESTEAGNVTALRVRRRPRVTWLALAASVLVAVVIGWRLGGPDVAQPGLVEQVVAHVDHERFSIVVSDAAVSDERLARVVPANLADLGQREALISYAQSCVINGHTVPHLVMQGRHGPVTILLLPNEEIDGPLEIDQGGFRGVIVPVGKGSVAIVGDDTDDLEDIEKTVLNSVTWST